MKKIFKKIIYLGTLIIIFLFPAYLVRFKIYQIPTTLVELLIYFEFIFLLLLLFLEKSERSILFKKIKRVLFEDRVFVFGLFLLVLGAFIATVISSNSLLSLGLFKAYFVDTVLFLILFLYSFSYKDLKKILNTFLFSSFLVAVVSLFYFFSGNLTYDGRLEAIFNSPNFLAMSLAPAILVACWNVLFKDGKYFEKISSLIALIFLVPVFLLTYSFGAFLGLFIALFLMLIFSRKSVFFKISAILFLFFLVFGVFFTYLNSNKNIIFLFKDDRSSLKSREMIWSATELILKENYIFGIGPGMFQKYYLLHQKDFKEPYLEWAVPYPHNIFLAFWVQIGVLGFLGFLFILFSVFRFIWLNLFEDRGQFLLLLLGFFMYFLIHGLVDTPYWKNDLALIFFLFLAIFIIIKNHNKKNKHFGL